MSLCGGTTPRGRLAQDFLSLGLREGLQVVPAIKQITLWIPGSLRIQAGPGITDAVHPEMS